MTAPHSDAGQHDHEASFREIFDAVDAHGFVHARDIDGPGEVAYGADARVVLASVFKIPIALEYARQAAEGTLDRAAAHAVTTDFRLGGNGTSGFLHDVRLSARDLAFMMMTISDNAAADVLYEVVGPDAVRASLDRLGFPDFGVASCRDLDGDVRRELGLPDDGDLDALVRRMPREQVLAVCARDPDRSPSSTPREVTALLAAIWRDEAGPAAACAEVRDLMSRQIWQQRLASGFGNDVVTAGKVGTEWGIRNEVGVVAYPDGRRYAVGVFVRTHSTGRDPQADASIGRAARLAVDLLRT